MKGGGSVRAGGIINGAIRRRKGINNMNEQATKHTPGALRAAQRINRQLGAANVQIAPERLARIIDRETTAPDLLALAARGASLADAVAESAYDVSKHTEDIRRLAYWAYDARYAIRAAQGEV